MLSSDCQEVGMREVQQSPTICMGVEMTVSAQILNAEISKPIEINARDKWIGYSGCIPYRTS